MRRILALRDKAKSIKRTVVLPEGGDKRVVKAASFLAEEGIVNVILLGAEEEMKELASELSVSLDKVNLVDPAKHDKREEIVNTYYELRKNKGMTFEEAEELVLGKLVFYAAVMTRLEMADGFVAGAVHTTGDVARASIHCLKIDREVGTVSSSFLIEMENSPFGEDGLFAFGDCGIIP